MLLVMVNLLQLVAMLFLHFFENIAMCVGLMPITGIPLPFISYGGSNFMTNIIGVSLAVNAVKSRTSSTRVIFQEPLRKRKRHRRMKRAAQAK